MRPRLAVITEASLAELAQRTEVELRVIDLQLAGLAGQQLALQERKAALAARLSGLRPSREGAA